MPRMTKQKKILHTAMGKCSTFFDAYDLQKNVEKEGIGIATIYRFLKRLEENCELHSFICDNRKIYSTSKKNHAHFTCEVCNTKKHISIKHVDFLEDATPGKVCHFQVDITGVCKSCQKQ